MTEMSAKDYFDGSEVALGGLKDAVNSAKAGGVAVELDPDFMVALSTALSLQGILAYLLTQPTTEGLS